MAPKVCVPADFGRHHIGAPSHGNLTFNLGEGVKIRANSIILSLNSPVIDELTTNLHQTSLEADDFSREAVDCFVESTYTGEIEAVNLGNFRDVNKMSRVFQVSWLVAKCEEYFVSYLDKLDSESSYSDMLFVVEEAVYLMSAIKSRDFLDLVVIQMNKISAACRNNFVQNYMSDVSKSSTVKIDACLIILQSDVHVMIELLISRLQKREIESIDESTRHLLKNADLITCGRDHPEVLQRLFKMLENVQCQQEDFRLLLNITSQVTSQPQKQIWDDHDNPLFRRYMISSQFAETFGRTNTVSVNFFAFPKFLLNSVEISNVVENLVSIQDIQHLYAYIDALWSRLFQGTGDEQFKFLSDIVAVKERRGWGLLSMEYVNQLHRDRDTKKLLDPLRQCNKLVSKSSKLAKAVICPYLSSKEFVRQFFLKDSLFTFSVSDPKFANQEFVLKTTSMKDGSPGTFTMKYGFSNSDDEERSAPDLPKLHFAIERKRNHQEILLPLSWCGKPTCDVTKTYWNWGYIKFHTKVFRDLDMGTDSEYHHILKEYYCVWDNENCRLVAYLLPVEES